MIDVTKILIEAKNRCIMYKGGKLPKEMYSEEDYLMDKKIIRHYERGR